MRLVQLLLLLLIFKSFLLVILIVIIRDLFIVRLRVEIIFTVIEMILFFRSGCDLLLQAPS